MKQIVEVKEGVGLEGLLGENVLLLCANYFYTGKLTGVNDLFVQLTDPAIVYETGEWKDKQYKDSQKLHTSVFYVQRHTIEAFGVSK